MKTSDAITWVFQHPELSLAVAGGLAILLLALSIRGIRRTLRRRREALIPLKMTANPAMNDVADAARAAAERADNGDNIAEAPHGAESEPGTATLEPAGIENEVSIPEPEQEHAFAPEPEPEPEPEPDPDPEPEPEPEQEPEKPMETNFRAITQAVFDRNFPRLDSTAYVEAAANFAVFADRLAHVAAERLSPDECAAISHADVQLLLCSLLGEVSKREDGEKYGVLIALLVGRIKHHENPNIVELMDHAIAEVGSLNVGQLRVVIMCLYLRGF